MHTVNNEVFTRKLKLNSAAAKNRSTIANIIAEMVNNVDVANVLKQLAKHSRTSTMAPLIVQRVHFM